MLKPVFTVQFNKDIKKVIKRGKRLQKLKKIISLLLEEIQLPPKNRNYKLIGDYKGFWECHIEPGWLLIYKKTTTTITLVRTGTHADLF